MDTFIYSERERNEVLLALTAILESPGFLHAQQLQKFLSYIVNVTLDGKAREIKGYTVGIEALGLREDFDPQTDTTVRVLAGRLRLALDNYSHDSGHKEAVRISIPKGAYVPVFDFAERNGFASNTSELITSQSAALRSNASLVLLLLAVLAAGFLRFFSQPDPQAGSEVLAGNRSPLPVIAIELQTMDESMPLWFRANKFKWGAISVISKFKDYEITLIDKPSTDYSTKNTMADYHITARASRVGKSEKLLLNVILSRMPDGVVLWSDNYEIENIDEEGVDVIEIAGEILAPLLSPFGVIFGDIASSRNLRPELECVGMIYAHWLSGDDENYSSTLDCAKNRAHAKVETSSASASLSLLYIERYLRQMPSSDDDLLSKAEDAASRAIALDPLNSQAYQANFFVHKAMGHHEEAEKNAMKALELNPFNSNVIGDLAAHYMSIGNWKTADKLFKNAFALNPGRPLWLESYARLSADLSERYPEADTTTDGLYPLRTTLAAIAVLHSGLRSEETLRSTNNN